MSDTPLTDAELRLARVIGEGIGMQVNSIRDFKLAMRAVGAPKKMLKIALEQIRDYVDEMIEECKV